MDILSFINMFTKDPSSESQKEPKKDIILFVNELKDENISAVRKLEKIQKVKYKIAVIRDTKTPSLKANGNSYVDIYIDCDLDNPLKIALALKEYRNRIALLACREERQITSYAKVIPHLPFLNAPTSESLILSTDKLAMRQRLFNYNKKSSPNFTIVNNSNKTSIKQIKDNVGFPLVIKPAGLASSLLVVICFHQEELEKSLNTVFKRISTVYKENKRKEEPKVLVESYLEGDQYSIDIYVSAVGKIDFCPMVYVQTGRSKGFDDFFSYLQVTPTLLNKDSIDEAQLVAAKSVLALGLRSTTAHIELMKTEDGWKVIEVGARMGGSRPMMYELSYGFDHALNDLLIRTTKPLTIRKTIKGYTAIVRFYASKEGYLIKLIGNLKVKDLKSYHKSITNKKIGDKCLFAKNGGKSVFEVVMFNKDRSNLLADIRRAEEFIQITTE